MNEYQMKMIETLAEELENGVTNIPAAWTYIDILEEFGGLSKGEVDMLEGTLRSSLHSYKVAAGLREVINTVKKNKEKSIKEKNIEEIGGKPIVNINVEEMYDKATRDIQRQRDEGIAILQEWWDKVFSKLVYWNHSFELDAEELCIRHQGGKVFKIDKNMRWQCRLEGDIFYDDEAAMENVLNYCFYNKTMWLKDESTAVGHITGLCVKIVE